MLWLAKEGSISVLSEESENVRQKVSLLKRIQEEAVNNMEEEVAEKFNNTNLNKEEENSKEV